MPDSEIPDCDGKKPCAECPFARATPWAGKVDPFRLMGQAFGPFMLPCHMDHGYTPGDANPEVIPCIGAAIFRANVGFADRLPDIIAKAPADKDAVFATPEEFALHVGFPPFEANVFNNRAFLRELTDRESADPNVQNIHKKRADGTWENIYDQGQKPNAPQPDSGSPAEAGG